ncbi:MAG: LptF/LptG family permease [Wigglesworthia glossinidia]|nr:LptF/LptG family permease [Wigglesworthia glossinidia]
MIILKYLIKKILKFQILILLILFCVFLSQKLVRILSASIEYAIPKKLILSLLFFSIPEILKLLLPLSLFLSIFLVLQNMQENNEIIAIHTCGIGYTIFLKIILFFNLLIMPFSWINTMWISPLAFDYKHRLLINNNLNTSFLNLIQGQFNIMKDNNLMLFSQKIVNKSLKNIFIVQFLNQKNIFHPIILVSESGNIYKNNMNMNYYINLKNGKLYYINTKINQFWITSFQKYHIELTQNFNDLYINNKEYSSLYSLWRASGLDSKIELHWRCIIVFSIFIMSILAITLGIHTTRSNRFLNLCIGLIFYLTFFFIQTFIYKNYQLFNKYSILYMWIINTCYMLFIFIFNYKNKKFICR